MNIKIGLLQLLPEETILENKEKGMIACLKAKKMGADLVVFPEMWSTGYHIPTDKEELDHLSISENDSFIEAFAGMARKIDLAIAISFLEKHPSGPRNSVCLIDRFGKKKFIYAKVHTCDFSEENVLTPGDFFYVTDLDIRGETVRVGAMICYDREFPESARILMLQGAELIIVPNACPMEINRLAQLRARAYENMLAIATVNYPDGQEDCNGHSTVFDGIAYEETEPNSRDTLIIDAGEKEGIYIATISLSKLRRYREKEVHGNAYRHPDKYHTLVEKKIEEPFIRKDYRK